VFTGIVEAALEVENFRHENGLLRIDLDLSSLNGWEQIKLGDSVALNGCCLTIAELRGPLATFEAVPETQRLTSLGDLRSGALINVERAMRAGARFDGHFVQGHVDATGRVSELHDGAELRAKVECGAVFASQCILKGSVCIDGISLTIAELDASSLTVAIIPHTRRHTNIRQWKTGTRVNLEADMIGKYVRRQLEQIG
jgi:riboflavin synthase